MYVLTNPKIDVVLEKTYKAPMLDLDEHTRHEVYKSENSFTRGHHNFRRMS